MLQAGPREVEQPDGNVEDDSQDDVRGAAAGVHVFDLAEHFVLDPAQWHAGTTRREVSTAHRSPRAKKDRIPADDRPCHRCEVEGNEEVVVIHDHAQQHRNRLVASVSPGHCRAHTHEEIGRSLHGGGAMRPQTA
eukprot:2399914-Rhodomonas_salina.2